MTEEENRKAFEAAVFEKFKYIKVATKIPFDRLTVDGQYLNPCVNGAWIGWCAHQEKTEAALKEVRIGGNHLANVLLSWEIHPTNIKFYSHALEDFGRDAADIWTAWRAIADISSHKGE